MKQLFFVLFAAIAWAQGPSNHVPGAVTAVNAGANQISIKTADGELTFTANERTQILRATAGVSDPKQWPKITLGEIGAGDEVVAYYRGALDQKPLVMTSLVVRTKADLGDLAQKQLDDWKKRGSTGTVTTRHRWRGWTGGSAISASIRLSGPWSLASSMASPAPQRLRCSFLR